MDEARPEAAPLRSSWLEIFAGRQGLYTALLNFGILLFGIDTFMVNTLMPTIVADIGEVAYYAWVAMLFVVGAIVGSASYGPVRMRLGGRNTLALGGATFTAAALACSLAPHMAPLLAARFVEGWGGGLIVAGSMSFTYALYEPRLMTRVIAFTSVTYIGAALVGPIIGGIFADLAWWRGAFWLYVPFGVMFVAGVLVIVPREADRSPAGSGVRRLPISRLLLLGVGVICVGAAGRVHDTWLRPAFLVGAVVIVWFAFARDARAENRLFPSHPLSWSRPVGLGYWVLMLVVSTYSAISIFLPLVLTVIYGIAPLYVGALNAMMSISWSITAALVAGLHGGAERRAMAAGPLCILAGSAGLAITTLLAGHIALIALFSVVVGFGIGFINVHMMAKVMAAALPGEESITASSLSTVRSLGQAFGSAMAGTIANIAGLEETVSREAVSAAASGVYLFNVIPLALAAFMVMRFFRASGQ
ncbi:MAG TPA: MFS transporter [Stellaceae bacterium]|nr:MFS transporter [Stellaceae bacterium]